MNWLQDLLTNPNSIAHIVALYAFVISGGVLLGKIKFFGISLGVTFVLFVGILVGHFGFTGNPAILSFLQDFGLILRNPAQLAGDGHCGIQYHCRTHYLLCVAGAYRGADDSRYPLRCRDEHAGAWCCQRGIAAVELRRSGNRWVSSASSFR